jgi:AraC family transcriptional regulator, regulatory protein of adaptative response / methylated-DNA-[protein]-cysteine methyltransferase
MAAEAEDQETRRQRSIAVAVALWATRERSYHSRGDRSPRACHRQAATTPEVTARTHHRRKKRVGVCGPLWQHHGMNDYERIASVIRYLDRNHTAQPDLAALATGVGLSPFHFHRLFSTWAGVTPKDFLQCLTLENVKVLLRNGGSVLDATLDAGLSSAGRLHDLCVTLEAASPGEVKNGGAGLVITYGFAPTPFGEALFGQTARGVCHLSFPDDAGREGGVAVLRSQWPAATLRREDQVADSLAATIFSAPTAATAARPLRAFVRGTAFQVRVWQALLRIPAGALTTYGRLSAAVAAPRAARAVGSAVGANPLAFLIPCHRVIRETGVLGHYRWDPVRKRTMIGWEAAAAVRRELPVASGF